MEPEPGPGYDLLERFLEEEPHVQERTDYGKQYTFQFQCRHGRNFLAKCWPDHGDMGAVRLSHANRQWAEGQRVCLSPLSRTPAFDVVLSFILWARACPESKSFCEFAIVYGGAPRPWR